MCRTSTTSSATVTRTRMRSTRSSLTQPRDWNSRASLLRARGSGHYDFRGYASQDPNPIPPLMRRGEGGLYPADSQFADLRGNDGIADVALGRLPRATTTSSPPSWTRSFRTRRTRRMPTAIACSCSRIYRPMARRSTRTLASRSMPCRRTCLSVTLAHSAFMDVAALRSALFAELQTGAAVFNYFGHGGVTKLGKTTDILLDSDVDTLVQSSPLPLFTSMTCMTGSYAFPGYEALAPQLVRTQGKGAVAAWAATGQVMDGSSRTLLAHFFRRSCMTTSRSATPSSKRSRPSCANTRSSAVVSKAWRSTRCSAIPRCTCTSRVRVPAPVTAARCWTRPERRLARASIEVDTVIEAVASTSTLGRTRVRTYTMTRPGTATLARLRQQTSPMAGTSRRIRRMRPVRTARQARAVRCPGASAATAPASLFMLLLALLLSRRRRATRY